MEILVVGGGIGGFTPALSENYKRVAGFEREALAKRESFL